MKFNQTLGMAIKLSRVAANESQKKFGESFDVKQQNIAGWEQTGVVPSKHWQLLNDKYGVDVEAYSDHEESTNGTHINANKVIQSNGSVDVNNAFSSNAVVSQVNLSTAEQHFIDLLREHDKDGKYLRTLTTQLLIDMRE